MSEKQMKPEDIISQISTITTIPPFSLQKLATTVNYCICNSVYESTLAGEELTALNIGIGTLLIRNKDKELQYKFIPGQQLERGLVKTITKHENPLTNKLERTFTQRIVKTYKDMF